MLSLGGTCVVQHLDGYRPRFATEVRSGGGPIYGHDFVSGRGITGLERTDPVLTAAVLECHRKPPAPEGPGGLDAFGHVPEVDLPDEDAWYAMVALGRRDMEPGGLRPLLPGAYLAGATSDVCILITPGAPEPRRRGALRRGLRRAGARRDLALRRPRVHGAASRPATATGNDVPKGAS